MSIPNDFDSIEYLKSGNQRQQNAYRILTESALFIKLQDYQPILVGTIPIGIDIANSDLDIICYWNDKTKFTSELKKYFNNEKGFQLRETEDAVIANFFLDNIEIEIFAQNAPSKMQNAYRHMIIEYDLLVEKGEEFRKRIIELKKKGLKTEPAFAQLLGLEGDPYIELLKLEKQKDR